MARYTIHAIDSDGYDMCDSKALSAHPTAGLAKQRAEEIADQHFYGVCIRDSETGLLDFGHGFGNLVPDPEADDPDEVTVVSSVTQEMADQHTDPEPTP